MELIDYFELPIFKKSLRWVIENNKSNQKPYHNLDHLLSTFRSTQEMSKYYNLSEEYKKCLGVAALFHDVNHQGVVDDDIESDWVNVNKALDSFLDFQIRFLRQ